MIYIKFGQQFSVRARAQVTSRCRQQGFPALARDQDHGKTSAGVKSDACGKSWQAPE
jgi:hypothetical protein